MSFIQNVDVDILLFIQEHLRIEGMNWFWESITTLGNGGWFWIFVAVILLLIPKTRKTGIAALLALLIGALCTNVFLKNIVARTRPYDAVSAIIPLIQRPTDFSFPSGHTTASFACAFVCYHMLPKKYGIPALCLAALIAFSRLYLGVHYPTDVLAGFLIALVSSMIAIRLTGYPMDRKKQRRSGNGC